MGKYPAYPEYKDSGIAWLGDIPAHWYAKQIRFISIIHNGSTPKSNESEFWDGDIVWITPEDLGNNKTKEISSSRRTLTIAGYVSCGTSLAKAGSIVVSTRAPIGHIAKTTVQACVNQGCRLLEPSEGNADYWYYTALAAVPELQNLGQGTTFLELPRQKLASVRFPVPDIEEQQAIACFLDRKTAQIDALIAKKEALLAKMAEKRTALISQAVTRGLDPTAPMKDSGIPWLGTIPAHWDLAQLKRKWKVIDCKHKTVEFINDGYPIASIGEVRNHKFNLEQAKKASPEDYLDLIQGRKPEKGDLIYSRNATVGSVGFIDQEIEFCLGQDVCLIKADSDDSKFLWWQLQSLFIIDQLQAIFVGATFKRINVADIKAYWITCPPINEQVGIALFLDKQAERISEQVAKVETAIAKLKEYRTALITAAVTGKIDVRSLPEASPPMTPEMEAEYA